MTSLGRRERRHTDVAGAALGSEPRASRAGQYDWYGQAASPLDRAASVVSRSRRPAPPAGSGRRSAASGLEAAAADPGGGVPGLVDARDLDHVARVRRVDELAPADVDARVAEAVEEDEVAGFELLA